MSLDGFMLRKWVQRLEDGQETDTIALAETVEQFSTVFMNIELQNQPFETDDDMFKALVMLQQLIRFLTTQNLELFDRIRAQNHEKELKMIRLKETHGTFTHLKSIKSLLKKELKTLDAEETELIELIKSRAQSSAT